MEYLIFKTDIKTKRKVKSLNTILNHQEDIVDWSVDTEDVDNVLRVEVRKQLTENKIIELVSQKGYYCEALED